MVMPWSFRTVSRMLSVVVKAAKRNVFLAVLFLATICARSQDSRAMFRSKMWQTEDGLPRNSVAAISQTQDGFLWIGTGGGLARFDGVEFETFPIEPATEKYPSITALSGDDSGGLWVGTGRDGLFYLKEGKWTAKNNVTFTNSLITCLRAASNGVVWVGTQSGLWRHQNGAMIPCDDFAQITTNYIRSIYEDSGGDMWISYSSGLVCLSDGSVKTNYPAENFPDLLLRTAIMDRRGTLWVGSRNGLSRQRNQLTTFYKSDGLPDNIVSALHEDRRGILWVGTYGGLARRTEGKLVTETTTNGDSFDQVFCFHEDHEGNLWTGTKEGLFRLSPQYCETFTRRHGLAHNNVITVLPSSDGDVWTGTWGGGLNKLSGDRVHSLFNRARLPEMRNDLILALCERKGGGLWFGTDFGGGLYELKPDKAGRWKCIRYDTAGGPALRAIRAIARDARENVWVGTSGGLYRLNGNALMATSLTGSDTDRGVRCLLQGRDGKFWIGTEQGLVCWTATETNSFTTQHGLSDNRVLALHEDEEGTLWIGTAGGGLNRMLRDSAPVAEDAKPGTQTSMFQAYTTADGLHNNTILEILETREGYFWMSSYHGIFCVKKEELEKYQRGVSETLRCLAFGQEDGMESAVCVGAAKPSGGRGKDGRLWFPTTKGLVAVNPNIPLNEKAPPVVIRRIVADRKPVDHPLSSENDASRTRSEIEIPPGRGELEIHFSALSFQAPARNRYRYKLEGVDHDWVEATKQRSAGYHNLKPGRYTFRVIAANNHGVWNATGANVTFQLLPHFWQTWVFKFMVAGMFGLVLFAFDRVRLSRIRAVEQLRLRMAADLHDEVGSNLGSVSMLTRLLRKSKTMTPEEQRDVALIERVTAETANAVKDIVWFTNPDCDTMQDMLMRMKDTAETMLTSTQCEFESHVENMEAKLPLEFRKNTFLIFKETLANIIKHSQATSVRVSVSEKKGMWELCVRDNGIGFNPENLSRGNGLKNFQRRADQIGAMLKVQSNRGQGTSVRLTKRLF